MRWLLFVLLGLFVSGEAPAQEKAMLTTPRLLPGGGVADPAGKVGFVPNTTGGIDALDLTSGKRLWTAKDVKHPLLATESRLFAQSTVKPNQVRLIGFDTTKEGKRVIESQPIALPEWVSVNTVYGRTFRSGARVDSGALYLSWEARAFYAGGARPTPEIEKAARKEASGVFRVDLESAKSEPLAGNKLAPFFPFTSEVANAKVGALTLSVQDTPTKMQFKLKRTLQAADEKGAVVWRHEIAAPVFLPPPP